MPPLPDSEVERILVVTAHPDDVDFGAAGTVATWTAKGIAVSYCLVTDGDAGGFDNTITRAEMAALRRKEQTAAASEVGVHDLHFLAYPDGRLTPSIELRRDITRVIRRVKPQRVATQSPMRNFVRIYASHPDHLAVGEATLCAVYPDARNEFAHTELLDEGLEPWTVPEVWLMGGPEPDHAVDITETFARKMAALRRHESQHLDPDGLEDRMRMWGAALAVEHQLEEGRLAESFRVVNTQ